MHIIFSRFLARQANASSLASAMDSTAACFSALHNFSSLLEKPSMVLFTANQYELASFEGFRAGIALNINSNSSSALLCPSSKEYEKSTTRCEYVKMQTFRTLACS